MKAKSLTSRSILFGVLISLTLPVLALDTDIYLMPPRVSRDDSPNVLIILDTSGSMETEVTGSVTYNPSLNYCSTTDNPNYDGTSTCFNSNYIYWSSGGDPTDPNTNKRFSAANNECAASAVNLGTTAGATGKYNDHIAGWIIGNNARGKWGDLTQGTDHQYVECRADAGQHGPNGATAPDGNYATNATSVPSPYTDRYTTNSTKEYSWKNKFTLYSANYLNFKKYPPPLVSQTRMAIAKQAIKTLIDSNRGVRFGLMVFNRNWDGVTYGNNPPHGGRVIMRIDTMTDARRTSMKNLVDILSGRPDEINQSTPLAETMYEAYRYFSASAVQYGDDNEEFEGALPSPLRDLNAETGETLYVGGTYTSPFAYQCQQSYVIYVTDGAPQLDNDADSAIQTLAGLSSSCGTADPNSNFSDGRSCLDDLASYMYNNDLVTGLTGTQRVITHTVGFSSGVTASAAQLLRDTARAGHGKYYDATDATMLASALQNAIVEIQVTNSSFAAPSLSVNAFNKLFNRDEVYFALFKPSTTVAWDGNIKKYKLCADSSNTSCTFGEVIDVNGADAIDSVNQRIMDTATSYWGTTADGGTVKAGGAGAKIPSPSSRLMYTYMGSYPIASPVTLSQSAHLLEDANAAITASMLGLPATATATDRTNLINWIRGQDVYDYDQDGDTTEDRWKHADPLHSRPVAITYGGNATTPIIKLFVGTNDGAVRMFNDANGQEEWAFIPPELLSMQYDLSQDADNIHPAGMDGTPTFWVVDNNNNGIIEPENATGKLDKIYMFIGMRRGGRNIYAFDVTPTSTLTSATATATTTTGIVPKLMWVIRGGVDSAYLKLGQTWSRPLVTRIRYGISTTNKDSEFKTVLIFGGGYDTNQDDPVWAGVDAAGNAIYIADPIDGSRIWWASGSGSGATLPLSYMDYSIPSDLALMDPDGDGATDRIYVGDMGGQLWRIDLSPAIKSSDTLDADSRGFRLADIGCTAGTRGDADPCTGTPAQHRRKFHNPPDVAQVEDSTYEDLLQSKYDLVIAGTGDREDPLDNLTYGHSTSPQAPVYNKIYAFRDYNIHSLVGATAPSSPLTEANLYNVTPNYLQDTSNAAQYDQAITGIKASNGWYLELKDAASTRTYTPWVGEKVLAKPVIFAGAIYVTTYTPANEETSVITCAASEGLAKLYTLGLYAGTAIVDTNNDGQVTTADRVQNLGGGIPSELITVIREGGTSALVGTSGGAATPKISGALPRFKTYWYEE
jgi:type IV pilus assembly protein PilY1